MFSLKRLWLSILVAVSMCLSLAVIVVRPQTSPPKLKVPADFNLRAAMKELYGNYDSSTGTSLFVSPSREDLDVRILLLATIPDSGSTEVLLATFAFPHTGYATCHACAPEIGAALFRKNGGRWSNEISQPPSLHFGQDGESPDAKLVKFGPHRYGIELEASGVHGGRAYTETALFLPWETGFNSVFYNTTMEDSNDEDACGTGENKRDGNIQLPCFVYHRKLKFMSGNDAEYYDLIIETSGTNLDQSRKVVDISGTIRLHFVQGKYVED